MTWAFVWIVLWLNMGGPTLTPEPHAVAAGNADCDDPDLRDMAYAAAVAVSDHKDKIVGADMWCDAMMAPDVPSKQPQGST